MWLIDFVKGFFKPTKSRIFLFVMVFLLIAVYDTGFQPFPDSPVMADPLGKAAQSFVVYFLVLPYILSCLLPSLFELRKRRIFRTARLTEFLRPYSGRLEYEEPVYGKEGEIQYSTQAKKPDKETSQKAAATQAKTKKSMPKKPKTKPRQ